MCIQRSYKIVLSEYFATQKLMNKSDIYNFGVVMIELLIGKNSIGRNIYIIHNVRTVLRLPYGVKEAVRSGHL